MSEPGSEVSRGSKEFRAELREQLNQVEKKVMLAYEAEVARMQGRPPQELPRMSSDRSLEEPPRQPRMMSDPAISKEPPLQPRMPSDRSVEEALFPAQQCRRQEPPRQPRMMSDPAISKVGSSCSWSEKPRAPHTVPHFLTVEGEQSWGLAGVLPKPVSRSVSMTPKIYQIHSECNMPNEALANLEAPFVSTKPSRRNSEAPQMSPSLRKADPWPSCLLHPESKKLVLWDCLACIMLFTYAVVVPLEVFHIEVSATMMASMISIRSAWLLFWLVDMVIVLRTAVYVDNVLCIQWSKIVKKYVRSWMLLDLFCLGLDVWSLACLVRDRPILRVEAVGNYLFIMRGLLSFRVHKLLCIRRWGSAARTASSKVCWMLTVAFVAVAIAVHFLACFWFFVGNAEAGWVTTEELTDENWEVQYARSVQWALSRLPASSMSANMALQMGQERCLAIVATFGALGCGQVSVSFVTNFMARLERSRQHKKKLLEAANSYIHDNDLPRTYMKRVKLEVEQEDLRQAKSNQMKHLKELPEGIRQELFGEARAKTLSAFQFFAAEIQQDSAAEASLCSVVTEIFHLPEAVVFQANFKSKGLYLVSGCTYNVLAPEGTRRATTGKSLSKERPWWWQMQVLWKKFRHRVPVTPMQQVSDGLEEVSVGINEAMSEQALWVMAWQHQGTLRASSNSAGILLRTDDFYKTVGEHPNVMHQAVLHARSYTLAMNQRLMRGECCTDLPLADAHSPEVFNPTCGP